ISLLLRPAAMSRRTSRSRLVSEASTAPSPCCSAVPILARRARASSARRRGLARRAAPARAARFPFAAAPSRWPAPARAPASRRPGRRLGQPPPGPGDRVGIDRAELPQDRPPRPGVVVAAGPAVLRLGPGEPSPSLGAKGELGPLGERCALAGNMEQLAGRGEL